MKKLLTLIFTASGILSLSNAMAADPVVQEDYFHTGAGARYLRRADQDLVSQPLRGNITVLMGSGGNITVLSNQEGKFLVDAAISKSREMVQAALANIGPVPLKYAVNTHWHWDHTDGNEDLHIRRDGSK